MAYLLYLWLDHGYGLLLKISEMPMAFLLVYSTSALLSLKKFVETSKWRPFWKIMKYLTHFHFDPRYVKNVPNYVEKKTIFITSSMMSQGQGGLKVGPLYSCSERLTPGVSCKGNVSSIHTTTVIVFLSYTCLKKISINDIFSRSQVKCRHMLTGWPWHLTGHNSVNPGVIKMKQQLKCKQMSITILLRQTRFGFAFSFQDRLMPNLAVGGC